jgi:hypothetical protein
MPPAQQPDDFEQLNSDCGERQSQQGRHKMPTRIALFLCAGGRRQPEPITTALSPASTGRSQSPQDSGNRALRKHRSPIIGCSAPTGGGRSVSVQFRPNAAAQPTKVNAPAMSQAAPA